MTLVIIVVKLVIFPKIAHREISILKQKTLTLGQEVEAKMLAQAEALANQKDLIHLIVKAASLYNYYCKYFIDLEEVKRKRRND